MEGWKTGSAVRALVAPAHGEQTKSGKTLKHIK